MRYLLAITLVVGQAAGSWLCCCHVPRLFAAQVSAAPSTVETEPAAPKCPHCKPDAAPTDTDPPPAPSPPQPDHSSPGGCPHQMACSWTVLDAVPDDSSNLADHARTDSSLPALPVSPAVVGFAVLSSWLGGSDLPFLPCEAKLYSHHVLRC